MRAIGRALSLALLLLSLASGAAHAQSADDFAERARRLAAEGKNAEAARFFEYAIEAAPGRRDEWLREYADQLAWSGSAAQAAPLYREAAEDPTLSEEQRAEAARRRALALLWSGDVEAAAPLLRQQVAADPSDVELRRSLADALVGAARVAAGEQRNDEAADLLAEASRVDPARAPRLARERAEYVLYGGRTREAQPLFEAILARPDLAPEERRAALLGLARSFAWSGRAEEAIPVYDRLLTEDPRHVSGRIGRGQALSDEAEYRRARRDFQAALEMEPENPEAIRGMARTDLGLERPRAALARLGPLLAEDAPDPRTRVAAARARFNMGRPDIAEDYLRPLLAAEPETEGAAQLLEEVMLERAPVGEVELTHARRSDDFELTTLRGRHTLTRSRGLAKLGVQARVARLRGPTFPDVDLASIGVFGDRRFGDAFRLTTSIFLNVEEEPDARDHSVTHETSFTYSASDAWRFAAQWNRRYIDESSRFVVDDVFADDFGLSATYTPAAGTRVALRGLRSYVSDGNRRDWLQFEAAQRIRSGKHQIWAGVRATGFRYEEVTETGYWNPERNASAEATLQAFGSLGPNWSYELSASGGYSRSWPGSPGAIGAVRARISRKVSDRVSVSVSAVHLAAFSESPAANGFFGNFEASWWRSEIGALIRVRF